VGSISNVTVRELPGNHATQDIASKRPTYTEGGGLAWLAFDGVDDSMVTGAIDLSGTDKVSLFAGVRKLDVTRRIIAELSSKAGDHAGTFFLVSGIDAEFTAYSSLGRGEASQVAGQLTGFYDVTNPITNVVSVTHDISGDLSTMRVDGVAGTSGTSDKGAGNFGNYPLFIGAREASSLCFNGNLYGLIVPGNLASADEIAATEAYLAAKTGVTL
jgi:hypothetical protein